MKVRRHARNVLCKVDSHRRIKNGLRWRFFACGRWWTSRKALLDALLPGLNALFNLEYAKLAERTAVIETIDELMGMESDRHPMFSEGYDYALDHIKQFVRGRDRRDKEEKNT
jgi:hypothetical protein